MRLFGWFRPKKADDVLSHWIFVAENFKFSSSEFYESVEQELKSRQVPGLEMSRVEFAEGGVLSDKRIYLRMIRERLIFDICAAPFGTAFFFSCRMAELPIVVSLIDLLAVLVSLGSVLALAVRLVGVELGFLIVLVLLVSLIYVMRNAVSMGLKDLDATIITMPVIGRIYEAWFRPETYYRFDTRLLYLDTVNFVVKKLTDEVTSANGVKLIRQYERGPILNELYKPLPPPKDSNPKS